jgi:16S rRNA (guanine527-N7)-methyltransferase
LSHPEDDTLQSALARYDLQLPRARVQRLERYGQLLWEWNDRLNLTRHTDWERFVTRDVIDSLQLSQLLEPGREVLDVGTGGGVPGVVLAILRDDLKISLCESVGKKARAVGTIVRELELPVPVYPDRAEQVLEDLRFDILIARAVGPLWKLCKWLQPHWQDFDYLLAVKGPRWVEERAAARERGLLKSVDLRCAASYRMPGTESESVILKLRTSGKQTV